MFSKIIEEDDVLKFSISKDASKAIVSGMRRTALSNILNVAFDQIEFKKNSTSLHNEFLSHRIGLIPVTIENIDEYEKYTFELKVNSSDHKSGFVNTDDIKVYKDDNEISENEKKKMFIQKPNPILITRFPKIIQNEYQEIDVKFKLKQGFGAKNSKFATTTVCTSIAEKDEYKFMLETVGLVSCKKIVNDSFDVLISMLEDMRQKLNGFKITVTSIDNFKGLEIIFNRHSSTTGFIVQEKMYNKFYNIENPVISHISFHETHPLENKLAIRIKLTDNIDDVDDYKSKCMNLLTEAIDSSIKEVEDLKDKFPKN